MTGGIPVDVVQFVERRFPPQHAAEILEILSDELLTTSRLMRAVLYLADGSLSLLKHYVAECERNTGDVLMHAEYVVGVTEQPMPVRDMSLPFFHENTLGPCWMGATDLASSNGARHGPRRRLRDEEMIHHEYLAGRRFHLGQATYLVAMAQPNANYVRCYREKEKVSRVVKLPLVFVLERFAEHIDIAENRPSDFISSVR